MYLHFIIFPNLTLKVYSTNIDIDKSMYVFFLNVQLNNFYSFDCVFVYIGNF